MSFTERIEDGVFGVIITLENGVELYPDAWNGEVYNVDGKMYKPVQEPDEIDDDGEVLQYKTIGYEEL